MSPASRLFVALRRITTWASVTKVRDADEARIQRLGATPAELQARFLDHTKKVEQRASKLGD